ncbi:MAG TPA: CoA ester lyase [Polyangiales bacterium]|nr:CoA ester lyase [Polyangiales bacterium]
MYILRSILSVPALRQRFIDKAASVPADVILLDLEDSVPPARKAEARERARAALPSFDKRGRLLFVRPNDLATGLLELDLDAVVGPGLDGIHLPKTHDASILERTDHYLTLLERARGLAPGSVRIIAWIESAQGVANVERICRASPRLIGASMGAEDYATSLGVMRTREGLEIEYARARVANAALAAGLTPIDCPEPDYRDLEHFERDIRHARALGYRGKYCIHPDQVAIANRVFAPSAEQLTWAERVRDAYEAGEREGLGAVGLDGAMVDRPIYVRALELLSWQAAIGAQAG